MLKRLRGRAAADDFEPVKTSPDPRLGHLTAKDDVEAAACIVWAELGSGHWEDLYRSAMAVALEGHSPREEVTIPVRFLDRCVGTGRADLVLSGNRIVELKTVARLSDHHRAQLRAYMRSTHSREGWLVNFPPNGDRIECEKLVFPNPLRLALEELTRK